jgi:putative redox protein
MSAPHVVETQWIGGMQFNADVNGHTIVMDAPERAGGNDVGPIPKPLVLTALSGCTGMDVAALLRKAGKTMDEFAIRVTGQISPRPPIEYVSAHLTYEFRGSQDHRDAALDAVTQSQEKFCGVSSMLKKIMPVTWDVFYNGEKIFSNVPAETHETSATAIAA